MIWLNDRFEPTPLISNHNSSHAHIKGLNDKQESSWKKSSDSLLKRMQLKTGIKTLWPHCTNARTCTDNVQQRKQMKNPQLDSDHG